MASGPLRRVSRRVPVHPRPRRDGRQFRSRRSASCCQWPEERVLGFGGTRPKVHVRQPALVQTARTSDSFEAIDRVPMMRHDQAMCLAAAQLLSARRGGGDVKVLATPDEQERRRRAIDLEAQDSFGAMAIEHTLIEPFPDEIRLARRLEKVFPETYIELPSLRTDRIYRLVVPVEAVRSNDRDPNQFRARLLEWVDQAARTPHSDPLVNMEVRLTPPVGEFPNGIGLEIRAAVEGAVQNGKLSVARVAPPDLELERLTRIESALELKLPKLVVPEYSQHTTMLVLETTDIALTNNWLVTAALKDAIARKPRAFPDYVLLAITYESSLFTFLYERGEWLNEDLHEVLVQTTTESR